MQPVKLGIIGTGIAARDLHWPALQQLQNKFKIVMVCNHTEPKAKKFAEMVGGVPYVLDYNDLLKNPDLEAVDIVLPIYLNHTVTVAAARAGKHILLEKPLAINLQEAAKLLELPNSYNQVMMVAENFRYRPLFQQINEILRNGKIGEPYTAIYNIFLHINKATNKYACTSWRMHPLHPGGFITDGGVHNVAALRYLFGKIKTHGVFTQSINPAIGKPDSFSMHFSSSSGVKGTLNLFYSANGFYQEEMIIFCNKGSLIASDDKLIIKRTGQPDAILEADSEYGYRGEFEDFYQAIRTGKPPKSTFAEAYRDLEVILTALEAAV